MTKQISFAGQIKVVEFAIVDEPSSIQTSNPSQEPLNNIENRLREYQKNAGTSYGKMPDVPLERTLAVEENPKLTSTAKVFTYESSWNDVLQSSPIKENQAEGAVLKCIEQAELFADNISKCNFVSFNCLDINYLTSSKEQDPKFLVLEFEGAENFDKEDLVRIILPVFLAMSNILTPDYSPQINRQDLINHLFEKSHQDNFGQILDDVLDNSDGKTVGRQASVIHNDLLFLNKLGNPNLCNTASLKEALEIIEMAICEHINVASAGQIKTIRHINPKSFERLNSAKITTVNNPTKSPKPKQDHVPPSLLKPSHQKG